MQKNKLVIDSLSFNQTTGISYREYLLNLLKYLKRKRYSLNVQECIIVCKDVDAVFFQFCQPEINVVSFPVRNVVEKYYVLSTLHHRLKLNKDDLILFTNNYSSIVHKCKHLLVIFDLLYLRKNWVPNWMFRIQRLFFVTRSVNIADKIISISEWVKKDLEKNFPKKGKRDIVPIYIYFDFSKYEGKPTTEMINFCENKKYFLAVSASLKHKNLSTILQAFDLYCNKNGKNDLVLVGKITGCLEESYNILPQYVQQRIYQKFNISNSDLGLLYKNAQAFISATLFEGLGMPIVEAMYFNTPAIVSDLEVIREVSLNKAYYFNPLNKNELCNLLFSVRKENSEPLTDLVQSVYSEKNTAELYVNLINEMINQ